MNRMVVELAAVCLLLSGCGVVHGATVKDRPVPSNPAAPQQTPSVTFFQDQFHPNVQLTLKPDPFVQKELPNASVPTEAVTVYLPLYPGAKPAAPNQKIGDMGTPMTPYLVDGTLYFSSNDSAAKIRSWYENQWKKLSYKQDGSGSFQDHGKTVSNYFSYSKSGSPEDPSQTPDINLGFIHQGNTTVFKLKVDYIITPPRPRDSYLPTNIVKVVLTDGSRSKTITDPTWISSVVKEINALQVSTMGLVGGGAVGVTTNGKLPQNITAQFFEEGGAVVSVTFTYPTGGWDVLVGKDQVDLRSTPELNQEIQAAFRS